MSVSCIAVLWIAGLPTLVMDGYNARDVWNREPGPGFPWTVVLSHDDVSALEWIRGHVADAALVQIDPTVRERASWAMIPVFARRHMATSTPLFLPNPERYKPRIDVVKRVYASADADEAWRSARSLGIEYLYVGTLEREAQPAGVGKFLDHPGFRLVFQNATVNVFRIVDPAPTTSSSR